MAAPITLRADGLTQRDSTLVQASTIYISALQAESTHFLRVNVHMCPNCRNTTLLARRWWNQTVRSLRLRIPLTVTPGVSCQDAVELMSAEGIDQVPVVEESGSAIELFFLSNKLDASSGQEPQRPACSCCRIQASGYAFQLHSLLRSVLSQNLHAVPLIAAPRNRC